MTPNAAAILLLLASCTATCGLSACSSNDKPPVTADPAAPETPASLTGTAWEAASWPGGQTLPRPVTIVFQEEGRAAGFAGVNRYFAGVTIVPPRDGQTRGQIRFRNVGSTKMAGPPEAMQTEQRFFDILAAADAYELRRGTLTLFRGRDLLLTLTRGESPDAAPRERSPR